jgi:senataxin
LQDTDFHIARISVKPEVAQQMSDNDLLLLTKDHPHSEGCRTQLHALGFMEGHEGSQSLRVKFYLTDDSQAGRPAQLERCAAVTAPRHLDLYSCCVSFFAYAVAYK